MIVEYDSLAAMVAAAATPAVTRAQLERWAAGSWVAARVRSGGSACTLCGALHHVHELGAWSPRCRTCGIDWYPHAYANRLICNPLRAHCDSTGRTVFRQLKLKLTAFWGNELVHNFKHRDQLAPGEDCWCPAMYPVLAMPPRHEHTPLCDFDLCVCQPEQRR